MSASVNNNKPVDQVAVGVPAVQGVAKQPVNQVRDTLVSGKESGVLATVGQKISAVFNWIKETVTSIFKSIFCCFYSKSAKVTESQPLTLKQQLTQDKALLEKLYTEFKAKKEADKSEEKTELKAWWKDMFTRLPQRLQDKIVKEDMEVDADNDGLEAENEITKYIDDHFNNQVDKNKTLSFVADLKVDDYGNDPIYAVPLYLRDIAKEIGKAVKHVPAEELVKKG